MVVLTRGVVVVLTNGVVVVSTRTTAAGHTQTGHCVALAARDVIATVSASRKIAVFVMTSSTLEKLKYPFPLKASCLIK